MKNKNYYTGTSNRIYLGIISIYFFIAICAPFLANEKPLFISMKKTYYFPAFRSDPYINIQDSSGKYVKTRTNTIDWKNFKAEKIIFAPVCWSPLHSDLLNTYSSPFANQIYYKENKLINLPFRFRHFLGTGKTGNDVLSGIIHGARTSVLIGFLSMTIAVMIGIILGGIAGYLGDDKLKMKRGGLIACLIIIIPAWFYSFYIRFENLKTAFENNFFAGFFQTLISLVLFIFLLSLPLFINFKKFSVLNKKIHLPVDSMISRIIEIFLSLPRIILILTLAAITKPSVYSIIMIIGLTSWTEIARLMRAQVLQLKEMNYISAAKGFGLDTMKILYRHLLPNALSQIIVVWIFGIASAIIIETGLSFLGIGVPIETPTWGSLMFEARENYMAWWLVIFTGLSVFLLLSSLFIIASKMKLNRRHSHPFS